jgi:ATP-dependent protease HslVU (ClpYQ) peptidase subunit
MELFLHHRQCIFKESAVTIIVSVKINDGIVMAADSAGTMESGQVYAHANKITNLCEGLSVGAMSTGSGGIGNESVETLLKDLRRRFAGLVPEFADWRLDPQAYTVEGVANRLRTFLFEEKAAVCGTETNIQLRVCGYSSGRPLAEVWEVNMTQHVCAPPRCVMDEHSFGVLWDGQYEALNRLILGVGYDIGGALARHGVPAQDAVTLQAKLVEDLYATLSVPAMPIHDAVDLARFLVETTIGFIRFAVFLPKSVGGAVGIAAITKHEGFQWVQRGGLLADKGG